MPKNTFNDNIAKQAEDIGYSLTWCIETKKMVDQGYDYFWSGEHHKEDTQRYNQRKAARKRRVYANPHILGSC